MAFAIELKNLDRIQANFAKAPKLVEPILRKHLTEAGKLIVRTEVKEAPHDTGNLQRSVQFRIKGLEGIIVPAAEYAIDVHNGTKPHSVDPNALKGWANRHGLNPYAVAHAIARKGTKANPFVKRTVAEVKAEVQEMFKIALKETTKALAKI